MSEENKVTLRELWDAQSVSEQQQLLERAEYLLDRGYVKDLTAEQLAKHIFTTQVLEKHND